MVTHTYYPDGSTLTGGGRTNTWDGENRLTQCVYNGTTSSFTYGSDGLRHRSVTGASTTDYVLDSQSAVRTLLNGAVDRTWLHGARGPEYERTGSGSPLWYLYDGLGSVLGTVDGSGNLVNTRKYDVYGAVRSSTGGSGPKHKFVGALGHPSEDETGLVYMRARYMDPVTGRFVGEDSIRSGVNWYGYCDCNPANRIDPSGKANFEDQSAATTVRSIIAGAEGGPMVAAITSANTVRQLAEERNEWLAELFAAAGDISPEGQRAYEVAWNGLVENGQAWAHISSVLEILSPGAPQGDSVL